VDFWPGWNRGVLENIRNPEILITKCQNFWCFSELFILYDVFSWYRSIIFSRI